MQDRQKRHTKQNGPKPHGQKQHGPKQPHGQKPSRPDSRAPKHSGHKQQALLQQAPKPQSPRQQGPRGGGLWLYGLHAARAALANPQRRVLRAVMTDRAAEEIGSSLLGRIRHELAAGEQVTRLLPPGAVHQGVALQCERLPNRDLDDVLGEKTEKRRLVVVLDQISDPHNVGAILRSATAFGASAVIVQDRNAPDESGTLAKAASGALDVVPYLQVVNISRALQDLGKRDFWRVALAGDGELPLSEASREGDVALVLGSEGSGVRKLVREHCDAVAYIPMDSAVESLNVSNAAAIALYELRRP